MPTKAAEEATFMAVNVVTDQTTVNCVKICSAYGEIMFVIINIHEAVIIRLGQQLTQHFTTVCLLSDDPAFQKHSSFKVIVQQKDDASSHQKGTKLILHGSPMMLYFISFF